MKRRKLLWHLYPYFLAISLAAILTVSWYALRVLYRSHLERTAEDLRARATMIAGQFVAPLENDDTAGVATLSRTLGPLGGVRVTVILPDGAVIGDSDHDPDLMDNHAARPEVHAALAGQESYNRRYSPTLHREMMYVAIPLRADGAVVGALRLATPAVAFEATFRSLRVEVLSVSLMLLLLTSAGSFALAGRIKKPVEDIRLAARRFAGGNLSARAPIHDSEEIGGLAEALNSLAIQLGDKISQLEEQRNEQAAVLGSMVESVVALDDQERILNMNDAAMALLGVNLDQSRGRGLHEVIRNPDLQQFVRRTLSSDSAIEGDLVIHNGGDRYLQAHGTTLRDAQGRQIGALIVLNDVTRLRRLENVRRDFVANVSHELKTPITSIKGFVETLADGAMADPAESSRFLAIIAKQADRLNSIIEDLLSLSRIEQDAEGGQIPLQRQPLRPLLASASQLCQIKAREKNLSIELRCPDDLAAKLSPALFEQSVTNLLDNAVKYSEPGSAIEIEARKSDAEVCVTVQDHGCGIERQHLPRLFERFYRVDKARSRQLGGTGLGLAIVKHIVQAHMGRVTVESTPGEGSAFTIHLPAA